MNGHLFSLVLSRLPILPFLPSFRSSGITSRSGRVIGATSEGPEKRKVYWIQLQLMGDHSATKEVEVHVKKVQTETINNLMEAT